MRLYYCVRSTYNDKMQVTAEITEVRKCKTKPRIKYEHHDNVDVYYDWFSTKKKAEQFIKASLE